MATRTGIDLEEQIERFVREHLVAQRKAAASAVERAFASAMSSPAPARRSSSGRRRPSTEMALLAERLYQAVRTHPGETMTVIAEAVGETPGALNRPMFHLKRAGKVRSAGERNLTRYFPMNTSKAA